MRHYQPKQEIECMLVHCFVCAIIAAFITNCALQYLTMQIQGAEAVAHSICQRIGNHL
jgi:hypothetical protein